jgi:hypothetical protein
LRLFSATAKKLLGVPSKNRLGWGPFCKKTGDLDIHRLAKTFRNEPPTYSHCEAWDSYEF